MSRSGLKALITFEVSPSFLKQLEKRNIEFMLSGWGQTGEVLTESELVELAEDCEIVIVEIENISENVVRKLPKLQFVGVSRGTPVNVDLKYCEHLGIDVVSTPGRNADSVADYCVGMMIQASRKLNASATHLSKNGWMYEGKLPYLEFRGREIGKLTVGLYGLGQIGGRVAERLHKGFGAKVLYFDPYVKKNDFADSVKDLESLFVESEIVSIHAPSIESTFNTVNRKLLSTLGEEGILINAARAQIVVEEDLYLSLKNREIAGAVLDVYWNEPLDIENRWLKLSNVICTPHIAGASLDVIDNHCKLILDGIDKWLSKSNSKGR